MDALKFERFSEKVYAGVLSLKRCDVTSLKQDSTAGIFLGNFRLFWIKQFHKNTSERFIGKGVHLFSKLSYCFGRATVDVVGKVMSQQTFFGLQDSSRHVLKTSSTRLYCNKFCLAGPRNRDFIKKILQQRCCPVEFTKSLRTTDLKSANNCF